MSTRIYCRMILVMGMILLFDVGCLPKVPRACWESVNCRKNSGPTWYCEQGQCIQTFCAAGTECPADMYCDLEKGFCSTHKCKSPADCYKKVENQDIEWVCENPPDSKDVRHCREKEDS